MLHKSILNTEHTESTEQNEGKLQDDRMTMLVILLFALHLGALGVYFFRFMNLS